jgi:hypothetical protein
MSSRNQLLAAVVRNDLLMLTKWALSSHSSELRRTLQFDFTGSGPHWGVPASDTWYAGCTSLGGPERVAVMLQRIEIDVDRNGIITNKEYKQNEKAQTRVVDACLAQLLNVSIVSGLTLTVFYPMAMTKLEPSQSSVYYLGPLVTDIFTYAYYIFMYYCVVQSVILIYMSARAYLHLSMWMSSLDMKMWYLDKLNISTYVSSSFNIIKSVVWSVPMGVSVAVSPLAGLLALGALLFFYRACLACSHDDLDTLWFMWQYTKHKLETRAECEEKSEEKSSNN